MGDAEQNGNDGGEENRFVCHDNIFWLVVVVVLFYWSGLSFVRSMRVVAPMVMMSPSLRGMRWLSRSMSFM